MASFWAAGPKEAPSRLGAGVGRAASYVAVRENWLRRLPKAGPKPQRSNQSQQALGRPPGSRLPPGRPLHTDKWLF